jgi:hypothetical protein
MENQRLKLIKIGIALNINKIAMFRDTITIFSKMNRINKVNQ